MTSSDPGVRVLVLFHSRSGNTFQVAKAIADGARSVANAHVDIKRAPEVRAEAELLADPNTNAAFAEIQAIPRAVPDDVLSYDVLILGAPTRLGSMSGEMKNFIDALGPLWQRGSLKDKVGAAFTVASTIHGGHEQTLMGFITTMMHLGMIVVAPGYTEPIFEIAGAPYGATASTKPAGVRIRPNDDALAAAAALGRRAATIGHWVIQGRRVEPVVADNRSTT